MRLSNLDRLGIDSARPPAHAARNQGSPMDRTFTNPLLGPPACSASDYTLWLKQQLRSRDPVLLTAILGPDTALIWREAPYPAILQAARRAIRARLAKRPLTGHYAGIGSRSTPDDILTGMKQIAQVMGQHKYRLRSGAAAGADSAFAAGCILSDIFLPWPGFRGHSSPLNRPTPDAFAVAALVHPAWHSLSSAAQKLMARNSHQILGRDLRQPADFVLCWTQDGCESEAERSGTTGGTGQAIALADRFGIPVFNLAQANAVERWMAFMDSEAHEIEDRKSLPSDRCPR